MVHHLRHPCPGVPFLFAGVGVALLQPLGAIVDHVVGSEVRHARSHSRRRGAKPSVRLAFAFDAPRNFVP